MSWFSTCYRQGFTNLGGPRMQQFDTRAFVQRWKDAGAELVYLDAIHQNETLFPTRLSRQAPILEGRDLVGEFVDACRACRVRPKAHQRSAVSGTWLTPMLSLPIE